MICFFLFGKVLSVYHETNLGIRNHPKVITNAPTTPIATVAILLTNKDSAEYHMAKFHI